MSITEYFCKYQKIFIQKAKIRSFVLIPLKNINNNCNNFDLDLKSDEILRNLEELNLYGKNFTKIDSNSFQVLKRLKILILLDNRINEIDSNGFQV